MSNQDEQDVEIVLMSNQNKDNDSNTFLGETIGNVVLDSGASGTVCGVKWYECFLETLPDKVRENIKVKEGKRNFKFGDGERLQSLYNVTLPCNIAGLRVDIITDVVDSDIPLLLSKVAMKRAKTKLNFENDTVTMLGKTLQLKCTSSGHYFIPITRPLLEIDGIDHIILFVKDIESKNTQEKVKIVKKLHRQFSHPSGKKLYDLAKDAGIKDPEFMKILQECPSSCDFCLRYKKVEPRPVVGFSLGSYFNETVSMDIKEIESNKVLHMIDHGTRYSVAVRLHSKESSEILRAIFKHWIAYFGTPGSFLTDNGREFNNQLFRDMAQNLNIIVRTTAAQSPWSNGLNERHNGILGESVKKTLEDVKCNFEIALAWAVSAKNVLHNVNGYSPNQLVFGKNPNFPSFLNDKLPALEGISTSEVVANNLNAMHAARKAFIESESSEKLRRAIRHQVRPSVVQSYKNGDLVLFKRNESERWLGPGTVIGWENKQVLVKHGGTYVRVHPCRLNMYPGVNEKYSERNTDIETLEPKLKQQNLNNSDDINRNFEPENEEVSGDQISQDELQSDEQQQRLTEKRRGRPSKQKSVPNIVELPKPGQIIKCKIANEESEWKEMNIISKAGKATGRNKYLMNVVMEDGEPFWLDFEKGVSEWKIKNAESTSNSEPTTDSDNISEEENIMIASSTCELKMAKKTELQSWDENKVCKLVLDRGQPRIATRWIWTNKVINGKTVVKARLVAKGFQDVDAENIRNDSPTCSKEGLRIALGIMSSYGWTCRSMGHKDSIFAK